MNLINRNNLVFGAKILTGTLVAAGAVIALGYGLESSGNNLINYAGNGNDISTIALRGIGQVSETIGSGIFYTGKTVAYSILVPAYTIGYVAPKWLITTGLPQGWELARDRIIVPLSKNIISAAQYIVPKIQQTAMWINQIFQDIVQYCADLSEKCNVLLRDYVVTPIINYTIAAAKYIAPMVYDAAIWVHKVSQEALQSLAEISTRFLEMSFEFSRDYILIPLAKGIVKAVDYIGPKIYEATVFVIKHISAFAEIAAEALAKIQDIAREYVLIPVLNGIIQVANYLGPKICALTNYIHILSIQALEKMAIFSGHFLHNVLIPLAQFTATKVHEAALFVGTYGHVLLKQIAVTSTQLANILGDFVIVPTIQAAINAAEFLGPKLYALSQIIHQYALDGFELLRAYVLLPILNGTIATAEFIGPKLYDAALIANEVAIQPAFRGALIVANNTATIANQTAIAVANFTEQSYERIALDVASILQKIFG